ncbi:MAG: hypothetical protein B6D56_00920 [Candidatus Omnitrophica bacterium 4484_70.1]|nr:MAG: hypothetical protein B6D56_00920 [Candidatus Omnitrophica bacterium 4484_70.1]
MERKKINFPNRRDLRLGEIFLRWGVIDKKTLDEALKIHRLTKKRIGEILVEKGVITEIQIVEALAQEYHLPKINLSTEEIDQRLLNRFPYRVLRKYNILPVRIENETLIVATNDPLNVSALQELRYISGYRTRPVLATLKDIEMCLNKYYGPLRSAEEAIKEIVSEGEKAKGGSGEELSLKDLEVAAQEAPVIKLVNSIIAEAVKQEVSDIHFEPQRSNLRLRFRIDGVLYEKMVIPKELQPAVISRIKIISGMDIAERRKPQDGRMRLNFGKNKIFDVRVSTLPDIFGEKVVLRLLNKESIILPLEKLGMDNKELKWVHNLIWQPYGMILVTGPTGSGKTTTLYSILNILNDATRNIVTVEDPVEYELDGINQTSINIRAGYTFPTAIRHILRQDPDVIMIGEIRDLETADISIQAALTGHLVFSTLHTNNSPGAITRLLNMNVEPFLISSAVIGVFAQRLVRKLCPRCKIEYPAPQEVKERIGEFFPSLTTEELTLAKPGGCEDCYQIGYSGRTGVFEILVVSDKLRQLILKRAGELEIANLALSQGMQTLQASGIKKAVEKVTSLEEVMRVTFIEKI